MPRIHVCQAGDAAANQDSSPVPRFDSDSSSLSDSSEDLMTELDEPFWTIRTSVALPGRQASGPFRAAACAALARRKHRSRVNLVALPEHHSQPSLRLYTVKATVQNYCAIDSGVVHLQVMARDGTLRRARTIFEWVQQHVIEQCAFVVALEKQGIALPRLWESRGQLPCQLALADGFDVPDWMGCGKWWQDLELYKGLVTQRRNATSEIPAAHIVLARAHEAGHAIAELVEEYLGPRPLSEFPCHPSDPFEFLRRGDADYDPSDTFECSRFGGETGGPDFYDGRRGGRGSGHGQMFVEHDSEDSEIMVCALTTSGSLGVHELMDLAGYDIDCPY